MQALAAGSFAKRLGTSLRSPESDRPERVSGDAYSPKPQPRPEIERFEPSSESSPPISSPDGFTVLHDRPDATVIHSLTNNLDSTSTTHRQSEAYQWPSSRPCQASSDLKTSSTSGICNKQPPQPLQEQDDQAPPQLCVGSLGRKQQRAWIPETGKSSTV